MSQPNEFCSRKLSPAGLLGARLTAQLPEQTPATTRVS